jgi:ABC-type branched-subunit amino acid transport system ATPase component
VDGATRKRADIAFIKTKPGQINDANVREAVQVTSLQHSHVSSLYSAIHNLYGPLLLREPEKSGHLSSGVQQLLAGK